jgi:hypothetical protein
VALVVERYRVYFLRVIFAGYIRGPRGRVECYFVAWPYWRAGPAAAAGVFCSHNFYHGVTLSKSKNVNMWHSIQ